jgi:hypothetical protein
MIKSIVPQTFFQHKRCFTEDAVGKADGNRDRALAALERGRKLLAERKLRRAISLFKKSTELDSSLLQAHVELATAKSAYYLEILGVHGQDNMRVKYAMLDAKVDARNAIDLCMDHMKSLDQATIMSNLLNLAILHRQLGVLEKDPQKSLEENVNSLEMADRALRYSSKEGLPLENYEMTLRAFKCAGEAAESVEGNEGRLALIGYKGNAKDMKAAIEKALKALSAFRKKEEN